MSKKVLLPAISLLLAAGIFAGCSPKIVSLWCYGLGEDSNFSIEYAATNSSYDGLNCTFTVRDEEDFIDYLHTVDDFVGTYPLADGEGAAYLFISGGNGYYCTRADSGEKRYRLAPCCVMLHDGDGDRDIIFAYPPVGEPHIYAGTIATIRDWQYFADFYSQFSGVQVDEATQTISMSYYTDFAYLAGGTVTLTYTDGAFTCTVMES